MSDNYDSGSNYMSTKPKFTIKQQRFIDFYDGNATKAARKAGYKHPKQSGAENLSKLYMQEALQNREKKRNKSKIADREERQAFWTESMRNDSADIQDRHKASELLGRSEADFTDNQRIAGAGGKDLVWRTEIIDPKNNE